MPAPCQLYPLVDNWLTAMHCTQHQTTRQALATQVTAVLVGQSLRPAARMRALLSAPTVPACQRYRRVARALARPSLSPERLTPALVRAALALVKPDRHGLTHLVLDSVRCRRWEILTLGVVWRSRVLLVGWTVLPYPWPKGQFTRAVCGLIRQVAAAWPSDRPVHLLADRGFPSRALFQTLRAVGWAWTVRLQARTWVTVDGQGQPVRDLLGRTAPGSWTCYRGAFGGPRQAIPGQIVVGRPRRRVPGHQRNPSSQRVRERQQARRRQHLASKHPGRAPDASQETDGWLVLFTSLPSPWEAPVGYRRRWAMEGSYRDAQSGWDGHHGWDLEVVAARLSTAEAVAHLVGLWALANLIQMWLGAQVATGPPLVRAVKAQWATTPRLSLWARGRLVLSDPSGELSAWLQTALQRGAERIAAAPSAVPAPARCGGVLAA